MFQAITWEETIVKIQNDASFEELVAKSYLGKDLAQNVEQFIASNEWKATIKIIKHKTPPHAKVADIGAGNGISTIALAKEGFEVTAIEPDKSNVVGIGAIDELKKIYGLKNIHTLNCYAEAIPIESNCFDAVYVRQAMHHAANLAQFIKETSRILKPSGFLFTIRDHIITNAKDKEWFLDTHPLQKFYLGENAYTKDEYVSAMKAAGLKVDSVYKYYDSEINYYPLTKENVAAIMEKKRMNETAALTKQIGVLSRIKLLQKLYSCYLSFRVGEYEEAKIPGRMYSFIAYKPQ